MSFALSVYHRLPPTHRSLIASLRGYYLSRLRYDKNTDKLVEAALERDTWSEKQWSKWTDERLAFVLERAATKVPYYRQIWSERRRNGDRASWHYLENWPILEKSVLRNHSSEFIADDCSVSQMIHDHTSGTTGASLDLWLTRNTVREWYALFEARGRYWHGLSRRDRWAILGGQLVTPVTQQKPPFWIWNAGMSQLYMSAYHLSASSIEHYLDALIKYKIKYILGYPSAIYSLAAEAIKNRRTDLKLDVVITNAEPLYEFQRETIGEAFLCPVRETYGMAEIAAAASECERGKMHQWPDTGIIESREPANEGDESVDFICTGLTNADMPLIRYAVGDHGRFANEKCTCGRTLPIIATVDGRSDDVLRTVDGRQIGRLDPIFKRNLNVSEAQIVQESLDRIKVRYVPGDKFELKCLDTMTAEIRQRMGHVEVLYEAVDSIPRTNRGKFRAVISNLGPQHRPVNPADGQPPKVTT